RVRRRRGRQARMPQRLGSVDVAQAGDQTLIEQRRLDWPAPRREFVVQPVARERRVGGFGAESQLERRASGMKGESAERAWIVEHDARAVAETHGRAGESWQIIVGSIDAPIARHTEVRVQRSAIVEHDQLMFAPAFYRAHGGSAQRPKSLLRDAAAK